MFKFKRCMTAVLFITLVASFPLLFPAMSMTGGELGRSVNNRDQTITRVAVHSGEFKRVGRETFSI